MSRFTEDQTTALYSTDEDDQASEVEEELSDREEVIEVVHNPLIFRHPFCRTSRRLSKYEYAALLARRSKELTSGAAVLLPNLPSHSSALQIAKEEIKHKKLNYSIRRSLPDGTIDIWMLSEMKLPDVFK